MVDKPFNFESKGFMTTLASYNVFIHIIMGVVVGIPLLFAFSATSGTIFLHIVLCVPGYQLFMAQSFLGLCPYNSWSTNLNTVNKRRAHWVLALLGSALAIAGSFLMMDWKAVNFNSTHGKLGLVALVFSVVNLVTGVAALYAQPLSKIIPSYVSKISHILFGLVAFVAACATLCYGVDKNSFKNWASAEAALGVIIIIAIFTATLCINPLYTCTKRFMTIFK